MLVSAPCGVGSSINGWEVIDIDVRATTPGCRFRREEDGMPYDYQTERSALFTENGQVMFIRIRDRVKSLLGQSGAVRMEKAIAGNSGDSWQLLACVDRMVELGEIREVTDPVRVAGQHRVFVSTGE